MELLIPRELLVSLNSMARSAHPNEVILLLRGERSGTVMKVKDLLFPPLGRGGKGYASFPVHMLPIDFTIIGTAHSHPNGNPSPSPGDLNNFYGRIMLITAHPYNSQRIGAYNKTAQRIPIKVV